MCGLGEQPNWAYGGKLLHDYIFKVNSLRCCLQVDKTPGTGFHDHPHKSDISCSQDMGSGMIDAPMEESVAVEALASRIVSRSSSLSSQLANQELALSRWTPQGIHEVNAF